MKDVPGYKGRYLATKDGRIFANGTRKRFLRPHVTPWGYETVTMWSSKAQRNTRTVHRLVAQTFIPNPENKPQVNHKDGNKTNNHVDNLEWATRVENAHHASVTGLLDNRCSGEINGSSKLTEKDVRKMLNMRSSGIPVSEIVKKFPVTQSNVYLILARKTWKHLH